MEDKQQGTGYGSEYKHENKDKKGRKKGKSQLITTIFLRAIDVLIHKRGMMACGSAELQHAKGFVQNRFEVTGLSVT